MFFFFKQKTAYEIKECDWSSDVCSSDLLFRAIDRHGSISTGATETDRTPAGTTRRRTDGGLDGQDIAEMIRRRVLEAGVVATKEEAAGYAGHSLRRGIITTLAEAGVEATMIQKISRHKSLAVLAGYVDRARMLDPSRNPLAGLI